MLALQTLEQALMIRRGRTHLPAGDRMRLLADHILAQKRQDKLEEQLGRSDVRMTMRFEKDRGSLGVYIRNLITATELASSFAEGGTTFDWKAVGKSPSIDRGGHSGHDPFGGGFAPSLRRSGHTDCPENAEGKIEPLVFGAAATLMSPRSRSARSNRFAPDWVPP
jgi:hypothetical protein